MSGRTHYSANGLGSVRPGGALQILQKCDICFQGKDKLREDRGKVPDRALRVVAKICPSVQLFGAVAMRNMGTKSRAAQL